MGQPVFRELLHEQIVNASRQAMAKDTNNFFINICLIRYYFAKIEQAS